MFKVNSFSSGQLYISEYYLDITIFYKLSLCSKFEISIFQDNACASNVSIKLYFGRILSRYFRISTPWLFRKLPHFLHFNTFSTYFLEQYMFTDWNICSHETSESELGIWDQNPLQAWMKHSPKRFREWQLFPLIVSHKNIPPFFTYFEWNSIPHEI